MIAHGQREKPQAGEIYEIEYPFVRDTYTEHYADEDGWWATSERPTWRPGVRELPEYPDHYVTVADGMGAQIVTVIGTYKPGKFPLRVFYTRQWRDPDGKVFGKGNCRITTIHAWRNLLKGFRVDFRLNGEFYSRWTRTRQALAELAVEGGSDAQ